MAKGISGSTSDGQAFDILIAAASNFKRVKAACYERKVVGT